MFPNCEGKTRTLKTEGCGTRCATDAFAVNALG